MSYENVALLLPCNGANGGTSFPDYSWHNRTVTVNGNAQTSTAQSKYYGSSLLLDGSGDYLRNQDPGIAALTTIDFTIELWFYPTSLAANSTLIGSRDDAANPDVFWFLRLQTDGKLDFTVRASSGSGPTAIPCNVITDLSATINTWNHVRLSRSGTVSINVNGTQASLTGENNANTYGSSTHGVIIGADKGSQYFTGHVNDVRFTQGAALSTSGSSPAKLMAPVAGTISDDAGNPVERRIWAIPRTWPTRVFSALSDSVDGSYSIDAPNVECTRVVLDDDAGTQYNDLIDRIDVSA